MTSNGFAQDVPAVRLCRLMCGRLSAFRQVSPLRFGLCPVVVGAAPNPHGLDGSAKRFRTSGGIADLPLNDFLSQSCVTQS